jgi:hypothetical protein
MRTSKKRSLRLFGEYYAVPTPDGVFYVREGDVLKSPHAYYFIEPLTNRVYSLARACDHKVDLLFSDLTWLMGLEDAYAITHFGGENGIGVIAAVFDDGTQLMTDDGHNLMFIRGFPHFTIFDERFIVIYDPYKRGPYVKIYNLLGDFVAEGPLWEAQTKALLWRPPQKQKEENKNTGGYEKGNSKD